MTLSEFLMLTSSADPEALEDFDGLLAKAWSENPHIPDEIRIQVGIAVAEIGANIIEHSGRAQSVNIRMEVRPSANEVWVEFVDDGAPVNINLDEVTLPDEMSERGRGLALAQAVLARLSYRRDGANHWTLVSKNF